MGEKTRVQTPSPVKSKPAKASVDLRETQAEGLGRCEHVRSRLFTSAAQLPSECGWGHGAVAGSRLCSSALRPGMSGPRPPPPSCPSIYFSKLPVPEEEPHQLRNPRRMHSGRCDWKLSRACTEDRKCDTHGHRHQPAALTAVLPCVRVDSSAAWGYHPGVPWVACHPPLHPCFPAPRQDGFCR